MRFLQFLFKLIQLHKKKKIADKPEKTGLKSHVGMKFFFAERLRRYSAIAKLVFLGTFDRWNDMFGRYAVYATWCGRHGLTT